jgi:hypothetical protein
VNGAPGSSVLSGSASQATPEASLQDILVFENDTAILEFRCPETGVLLWPLIRVVVIRMIMSDMLYGTSLDGIAAAPSVSWSAWGTLARSVMHNMRAVPSARVCIISTAVANQFLDGKWFNRLTDPFALRLPGETLVVEEPFEWRWQMPRYFEAVRFMAPRLAFGAIVGRLRVSAAERASAVRLVDLVLTRSRALLAWDCGALRRKQLVEMLGRKLAALPTQFHAHEKWLDAIRPDLLLVTGACYGPHSPLLVAANRRGITTAEYQHGAVSRGHDAYNFAPALANDAALRESLPAAFLGYGSWWHEQFNAPVSKHVIGNPHRTRQLSNLNRQVSRRRRILILSDGIEFQLYLRLAEELAAALTNSEFDVVLRPHPLERSSVAQTYGRAVAQIELDQQEDLYASLTNAHSVISEVSTGLFEAVGIAEKVFVWDTPKARFGFPSHPFHRFQTVPELVDLIADEQAGRLAPEALNAIWAADWASSYDGFLARLGIR